MEITLDIGQNVHQSLLEAAEKNNKSPENLALDMIELGLRIFTADSSDTSENELDLSAQLDQILQTVVEGRYQTEDIFRMIFDREKSNYQLFDAASTLALIKEKSLSFQEGATT